MSHRSLKRRRRLHQSWLRYAARYSRWCYVGRAGCGTEGKVKKGWWS